MQQEEEILAVESLMVFSVRNLMGLNVFGEGPRLAYIYGCDEN